MQENRLKSSWRKILNAILGGPGFIHRLCRAKSERNDRSELGLERRLDLHKAGDIRLKTAGQGGGQSSRAYPHQISPALHLPLNFLPVEIFSSSQPQRPKLPAILVKDMGTHSYQKRPSVKTFWGNIYVSMQNPN